MKIRNLFFVLLGFACLQSNAQTVSNPGELHNKIMGDLLNGNYIGSGNLDGYINAISRREFGTDMTIDATLLNTLKVNSVAGDPRTSVTNYQNAGLVNQSLSTLLLQVMDHISSWPDEIISPEEFNQRVETYVNSLTINEGDRQGFEIGINVLKKSYEFHYADELELPRASDNSSVEMSRCRGFWRKLCIIFVDFAVTAIFSGLVTPAAALILGGLWSTASACCGICCPTTQFCLDSNICCVTYGKNCGTMP